jgi:hypothetical protein
MAMRKALGLPVELPKARSYATMSDLYDEDFTLWTEQQATLLRRRAAGELTNDAALDWLNLAEEIEAVGGNTRRELRNRLASLLQHLLKWHYQPELRSRSWRATIRTQRQEIEDLLADNPPCGPDCRSLSWPPTRALGPPLSTRQDCSNCRSSRRSPSNRRL